MKRRILGVVLGAALLASLAVTGPAEARPAAAPIPAASAGACGPGMTTLHLKTGTGCIHTAHDPMPPGHLNHAYAPTAPVQPKCYGNGVNGARVRLLYGWIEGKANNAGTVVPKISKEWVPRIEATFRNTSREQGREIGVRFYAPGCKLAVDVIKIPKDLAEPNQDPDEQITELMNFVTDEGYDDADTKYMLWTDVVIPRGPCGVGLTYIDDLFLPINNNNSSLPVVNGSRTQVAITFGHCFGRGTTGALTETHELIHTLGAVMFTAPNSNKAGHCTDDLDIMCYTEKTIPTKRRCETPVHILDCGSDDYFHAKPPATSYLFTHWNTANSQYLGEAVGVDLLPVEHPRRTRG